VNCRIDALMILPEPLDGFEWTPTTWGRALRCTHIGQPHVFSTRDLPLRSAVARQLPGWDHLAEAVGVAHGNVMRPKQVHGNAVTVITDLPADPHDVCSATADIMMTMNPAVAVAVQSADCVPILLADAQTGAVAAVHAGWRGTASSVAAAAVEAMRAHFGSKPRNMVAAIGPSIGPCCYVVGDELLAPFGPSGRRWFYRAEGRLILNLWSANRDQLVEAGLEPDQVHIAGLCTAMHPELFDSFRRDGEGTGRLAAAIKGGPGTTP
jgi:purine-nucleoside/S-methyl-5'-thioadenosine phosphorylase / adenosine deaminase